MTFFKYLIFDICASIYGRRESTTPPPYQVPTPKDRNPKNRKQKSAKVEKNTKQQQDFYMKPPEETNNFKK